MDMTRAAIANTLASIDGSSQSLTYTRWKPESIFVMKPFTLWILGQFFEYGASLEASKENSLADWDGAFLPAPLGDDWELRDPYDPINNRHFLRINRWIFSEPAAFTMDTGINLRSDAFRKGYGEIVDDKTMWRPLGEEKVQDMIEALSTSKPRYISQNDFTFGDFTAKEGMVVRLLQF